MKKVFTVLILLAVVAGCVIAAGCTAATTDNAIPDKVAYTVTVTKEGGATYNVGDIVAFTFKTNPSTGYDWQVVKGDEVLYKTIRDVKTSNESPMMAGAPSNVTFWFQADKEGDYPIELIYARPWDVENTTVSTYSDVLHVVKSDDPVADGPKASFTFDSFAINPEAGEFVKIVTSVPATAYASYTQSGSDGLIIRGANKPAAQDTAGSADDLYVWYVTAAKPGDYTFVATLEKPGSSGALEAASGFTISLKFV